MAALIPLIIIAAVGGIAITLQAQFMGLMDKNIGTLESVFITYGSGGLLIGTAMLVNKGGNLSAWRSVPWYVLSAGVLGLVTAFTILVASQFIVGALLDHFGILGADLRPLDFTRLAGIGVMLLGVWLIIR